MTPRLLWTSGLCSAPERLSEFVDVVAKSGYLQAQRGQFGPQFLVGAGVTFECILVNSVALILVSIIICNGRVVAAPGSSDDLPPAILLLAGPSGQQAGQPFGVLGEGLQLFLGVTD